jgi:outer membrane protein assembly factor BamB
VGCRDANLYAIDAASGKERWSHPTAGSWVVSSPDWNDAVVVGADLELSVGSVLSSPLVVAGTVYFGGVDGNLHAIE